MPFVPAVSARALMGGGRSLMIDSAVLSYYHMLRINGWLGDLGRWLDAEFFGGEGLTTRVEAKRKRAGTCRSAGSRWRRWSSASSTS